MTEIARSSIRGAHRCCYLLIILEVNEIPTCRDINDLSLAEYKMFNFLIDESFSSENHKKKFLKHHSKNVTILELEHKIDKSL